jgi:hypothetical protein
MPLHEIQFSFSEPAINNEGVGHIELDLDDDLSIDEINELAEKEILRLYPEFDDIKILKFTKVEE